MQRILPTRYQFPAFYYAEGQYFALLPDGPYAPPPAPYIELMANPKFKPDLMFEVCGLTVAVIDGHATIHKGLYISPDGKIQKSSRKSLREMSKLGWYDRFGDRHLVQNVLDKLGRGWSIRLLHWSPMTEADLISVVGMADRVGAGVEMHESELVILYPRSVGGKPVRAEYNFDQWDRATVALMRAQG